MKPFDPLATDLANNSVYGNVSGENLHEARSHYVAAFLFACQSSECEPVINLLDKAIRLVPDFLDVYYLREETWHRYLVYSKGTPNQSNVYDLYLSSDAWRDKKEQVLKRDGYRCVRCNSPATEVHHKTYDSIGKEPLSDLTSVCKPCDGDFHDSLAAQHAFPSGNPPNNTTQAPLVDPNAVPFGG